MNYEPGDITIAMGSTEAETIPQAKTVRFELRKAAWVENVRMHDYGARG